MVCLNLFPFLLDLLCGAQFLKDSVFGSLLRLTYLVIFMQLFKPIFGLRRTNIRNFQIFRLAGFLRVLA